MRPRYLLKLFNTCKGFAVNLQHEKIEESDIEKGLNAFSADLVTDADHELTDIEPKAERLIYQFLGETSSYTIEDISVLLQMHGIPPEKEKVLIEYLLYYGFLGIQYNDGETRYIYDVEYNMELLKTRLSKNRGAIKLVLNPAFWPALEIVT